MDAPSSTVWNDQQRGHGNTGAWRTWMWTAVLNTGPSWARIRVGDKSPGRVDMPSRHSIRPIENVTLTTDETSSFWLSARTRSGLEKGVEGASVITR